MCVEGEGGRVAGSVPRGVRSGAAVLLRFRATVTPKLPVDVVGTWNCGVVMLNMLIRAH